MKSLEEKIKLLSLKDQELLAGFINAFKISQESENLEDNLLDKFERLNARAHFNRCLLGSSTRALLVNSLNGLLAVDPEDMVVGAILREYGEYGTRELETIKSHLSKESKILVVGAHIGAIVVPLAKCCRKVVAVEANPKTYDLLHLNLKINHIENCKTYNFAASDKSEEIKFLMSKVNSGGSKIKPFHEDPMYFYDSPEEISIPAIRLDELLDGEKFDTIIMDIEGSEYFALKGMPILLEKAKRLFIEFIPHHLVNVAGVNIEEFIEPLKRFKKMILPSKNIEVANQNFEIVLKYMLEEGISEDSIIFK